MMYHTMVYTLYSNCASPFNNIVFLVTMIIYNFPPKLFPWLPHSYIQRNDLRNYRQKYLYTRFYLDTPVLLMCFIYKYMPMYPIAYTYSSLTTRSRAPQYLFALIGLKQQLILMRIGGMACTYWMKTPSMAITTSWHGGILMTSFQNSQPFLDMSKVSTVEKMLPSKILYYSLLRRF